MYFVFISHILSKHDISTAHCSTMQYYIRVMVLYPRHGIISESGYIRVRVLYPSQDILARKPWHGPSRLRDSDVNSRKGDKDLDTRKRLG